MEAQTTHERQRLAAIDAKVKDVQDKLETRLPAQRQHLAALVCGAKWRLRTLQLENGDAYEAAKKVRTELGAFDYRVKEQAELLTRYLLELDDILSYGDNDIKTSRKALVVSIQQLLTQADAFKERSAKLKQFGERLMSPFLAQMATTPATPRSESGNESDDLHVKALFEEEESSEDEEMEEEKEAADEPMETEAQQEEEDEEEPEREEEDEDEVPTQKQSANAVDIDVNSLPVWRPYYQLQRRQDGIYLLARLNGTDPSNVRVQWNDQTGVLRINGFRLPTQKDIMMSRLSGSPTFGRFEIVEQFPRNMLNMDDGTQQMFENGTLQIRMPYYVRNLHRYRQPSLFQPQDCFVW